MADSDGAVDLTVMTPGRRALVVGGILALGLVVLVICVAVGVVQNDVVTPVIGAAVFVLLLPAAVIVTRTRVTLDGSVITAVQPTTVSVDLEDADAVRLHRTPNGIVSIHATAGRRTVRVPLLGARSGQMLDEPRLAALRDALRATVADGAGDAAEVVEMQRGSVAVGAPLKDSPLGRYADSRLYDRVNGLNVVAALTELMR